MRASLLLAALLTLVPASPLVAAQERATLTVVPPSGPPGTVFQARATGLPPGVAVIAIIRLPTGEQATTRDTELVSPAGEWLVPPWHTQHGDPVGQYTLLIAIADRATVLASGTFTVTGPPTVPGRPPVQVPGAR
jgi:hypothetical protein